MKALIQLAMLIPIIGLSLQGCSKKQASKLKYEPYRGETWSGNGNPVNGLHSDPRGSLQYQFTDVQGCNYSPAREGCEVQGDGSVMYGYWAAGHHAHSPEVDFTGWTIINVWADIDATRGIDSFPETRVERTRHICLEIYDLNTGSPGNNAIGQQCKNITASDGVVHFDTSFRTDGRALNRIQFVVGVSEGAYGVDRFGPCRGCLTTTIGPTVHQINYSASR